MSLSTLFKHVADWFWELGGVAAALDLGLDGPCLAPSASCANPKEALCPSTCPSSSSRPLSR